MRPESRPPGGRLRREIDLLSVERASSLCARAADRWRDRRRRQSFAIVEAGRLRRIQSAAPPALNVLLTPPWRRLGGLQQQLLARIEWESEKRCVALLFPDRDGYRLEVIDRGRRFACALPASQERSSELDDPSLERAVTEALAHTGAPRVHFESLDAAPLGSLVAIGKRWPLILSVHDFSLFCPRPHLLEEPFGRFCDYSTDERRCQACLAQSWVLPLGFQARRRGVAFDLLETARAVVYPSDFLRRKHRDLFPATSTAGDHVIAPAGIRWPRPASSRNGRARTPHLAFVGSFKAYKGAHVFLDAVRRLEAAGVQARWSVLGGGEPALLRAARRAGVHVHGYYSAGSLPRLLAAAQVDLALVVSIVPESYSLTFDECLLAGVPVVAFDHGAVGERVRDLGCGLSLPCDAPADRLVEGLASLCGGGGPWPRVADASLDWIPTPERTAAGYLELYATLATTTRAPRSDAAERRAAPRPVGTAAFEFPAPWSNRALHGAAAAERALVGAARRLWRGRRLAEPAELRRLRRTDPADAGPAARPSRDPVVVLPAVEWSYRFQRPQQLARALADHGHATLYLEAFSRSRLQPAYFPVATTTGPLTLRLRLPGRPDPYRTVLEGRAAASAAAILQRGLRRQPAFILVQLPFWLELAMALRRHFDVPVVYDRLDLHSDFAGMTPEVGDAERELLDRCDLVVASSQDLLARSAASSARPAILLRNAVALEDFPPALAPASRPRRIGYVGALESWFDAEAVGGLAAERPQWTIELAGRVESAAVAELRRHGNVHLLGEIAYREVPAFMARLHALLIPFRDQPLTRAADPVKLYEGMAVGLPVVARSLPEIQRWPEPLVHLYGDPAELASAADAALAGDGREVRAARRAAVSGETWRARAAALVDAVAAQKGLPKLRKTT